jgi:dynein heavy chain
MDTVRMAALMQTLITHQRHVLVCGPTGTAKSITAQAKITVGLDREVWNPITITFSAQTSANQTQDIIDNRLDRRRKGVFGPPMFKRFIVFVDDLNMPVKEKYGAQPPIEILRQFMDHNGWFDRKALSWRSLVDIQFLAAMCPPGGGRNTITARYPRHFTIIGVTPFDDDSMARIFLTIVSFWMEKGAAGGVNALKGAAVNATIEVYNAVIKTLLPTPTKSHYLFNLRDISKVFGGMMKATMDTLRTDDALARLWAHECMRVFADRFINFEDIGWFNNLLAEMTKKHFKMEYEQRVWKI